jgi:hypothetical protein
MKTLVIAFGFLVGACGFTPGGEKVEYRDYPPDLPTPGPGPTPPGPGPEQGFAEVQKILTESCGYNGCHSSTAAFIATEAGLRGSSAKTRITNGSMPPRYAGNYYLWEDGTRKKTILDFLNRQ